MGTEEEDLFSEEGSRVFFRWEARLAPGEVAVVVAGGDCRGAWRGVWTGSWLRMEESWVEVMMRASVRYSSSYEGVEGQCLMS